MRVTFKDGSELVGLFNDEFYEESYVLVGCKVVKIEDIEKWSC